MLQAGDVHALRDPTRGGLGTPLRDRRIPPPAGDRRAALPVREEVKGACEILGMDPLYVANEGKLVAMVPESSAGRVLQAMRGQPAGQNARVIGRVVAAHPGMVLLKTEVGGSRILDLPFVEQLPRIC